MCSSCSMILVAASTCRKLTTWRPVPQCARSPSRTVSQRGEQWPSSSSARSTPSIHPRSMGRGMERVRLGYGTWRAAVPFSSQHVSADQKCMGSIWWDPSDVGSIWWDPSGVRSIWWGPSGGMVHHSTQPVGSVRWDGAPQYTTGGIRLVRWCGRPKKGMGCKAGCIGVQAPQMEFNARCNWAQEWYCRHSGHMATCVGCSRVASHE
mmetsp:Transcript_14847/g.33266  ORF Transcript_14847/g.33266 Transcript_14847/m.33266 type:complete len:207 (+) Transcript_14847:437-1057(+)